MSCLFFVVLCVITAIIFILTVAFTILIERKLLAVSQRRIGPIMLGKRGILQIVADVVKPIFKELFEQKIQVITTTAFNIFILFFSQVLLATGFAFNVAGALYNTFDFVIFLQFCCSSISCIAVLFIGALSGTKYAVIGAIRLIISEISSDLSAFIFQLIFFEACSGITWTSLYLTQNSYTLFQYVGIFYSSIQLFQTFVAAQRSPVDLIEVEGELVAGYNTEFSGSDVLVIYFAEYFHLFNGAFQFVCFLLNNNVFDLIFITFFFLI